MTDSLVVPVASVLVSAALTDIGAAERLVALYGHELRFVAEARKWIVWRPDLGRWTFDDDGEVMRRAERTARETHRAALDLSDKGASRDLVEFAMRRESRRSLENMVAVAAHHEGIPVPAASLDSDELLLNTPSGIVDLRTGALLSHDPGRLMTKSTSVPFVADATCPLWERTVSQVFSGDAELVEHFRRLMGYALTGSGTAHIFATLWGRGANGKTTIVSTVQRILGTYAVQADPSTFLRSKCDGRVRNDLARLAGTRLVVAEEPGSDRFLDESAIKALTGGGRMTARFLFREFFEFEPRFVLVLLTNHRPRIPGTDDGIWRRVRLVPFVEQFLADRADPDLAQRLETEHVGILAWLVRGALDWQREGFGTCAAIENATTDYRQHEDVLGEFIAARCVVEPTASCAGSVLFCAYQDHVAGQGDRAMNARDFARELRERGFEQRRTNRARLWSGVGLTDVDGDA